MSPSHERRPRPEEEMEQLRAENTRLRERLARFERYADDAVVRLCKLEEERDRALAALLLHKGGN